MTYIENILKHFKTIASIPHCSYNAQELKEYLIEFAKSQGYKLRVDSADNILISKGNPKLCLQAHYDMVCVGEAPKIELETRDGWLSAKESSLGADNGIAIAMMMSLMEESLDLEFLLTSDEEVGLLGAKALEFDLQSSKLLNLDYEDEGVVCIGCAGGVDIIATKSIDTMELESPIWSISLAGLPGGHSGVDIDKGIPNAIKELAQALVELEDIKLLKFVGGERRNSIPTYAKAIVSSKTRPSLDTKFEIKQIDSTKSRAIEEGDRILQLLATAPNGVVSFDKDLNIPKESLNLAIVEVDEGVCRIDYSLRAMSMEGLGELANYVDSILKRYGFNLRYEDEYPAWKPELNLFTQDVAIALKSIFGSSHYEAIHAGLECGVLSQKYPNIKMASIGPTIENPHSIRERVNIDSIKKSFEVLRLIINKEL